MITHCSESCPHLHHISEISKPDGFLADARRIEELEHLLAKSELRNDQLQSENKHLRSVINAKAGTPMLIGDDDEVEDGEVQSLEQGMKGVKRDAEVGLIEGSTHLTDHNRGMARDEMRTSSTAMRRYVHEHIKQEMEDGRENFALEYELDDHEVKRRFKMDFESELLDHGDF